MAPGRLKETTTSNPQPRHHPYSRTHRAGIPIGGDTSDLDQGSAPGQNLEDDGRILQEYKWTSYKDLPHRMQRPIEVDLLMRLLLKSGNASYDACATCLHNHHDVRSLLLHGWEKGTFQELRNTPTFISLAHPVVHCEQSTISQFLPEPMDVFLTEGFVTTGNDAATLANERGSNNLERASGQAVGAQAGGGGGGHMELDSDHVPGNWMSEENAGVKANISGNTLTAGRDITVAVTAWRIHPSSNMYRETAEWYFSVNYRAMHNEIAGKRSKKTGQWFLRTETYQKWCTQPQSRILWCHGDPGVGKTVMASLVVDNLRTFHQTQTFIGVIYFNYKFRDKQNRLAIIEALCRQMLEACEKPEVKKVFTDLYNLHERQSSRPTEAELRSAFSVAVQHYQHCYLVLDAFDEYTARYTDKKLHEVIAGIVSLGENVKLLTTSRILGEMKATFHKLGASTEEIISDEDDMKAYVGERVEALKSDVNFEVPDAFSERIVGKVVEASKGRFLVAQLGMNLLSEQLSLGDLEDALDKLPNEINKTYVCVIELIKAYSEARRELAMKALMWVAFAQRPLFVRELQHALATKPGRKETNKYVTPLSTITSVCAGLIVVQDKERSYQPDDERTLRFVHFTTQEFFGDSQQTYFGDPHKEMCSTCFDYLSITGNHILSPAFTWASVWPLQSHLPFYDYAARNWGHHSRTYDQSVSEEVREFLLRNGRALDLSWEYILAHPNLYSDRNHGGPGVGGAGIFIAAYHDQANALSMLLDLMDTIPRTTRGRTPLHVAVVEDRTDAVQKMVQWSRSGYSEDEVVSSGISPQSSMPGLTDEDGRTPISLAAKLGHKSFIKLLLEHGGVEVDSKDNIGRTPLSHAAESGREENVKLLLEHGGIEVDSKDNEGRTPLSHAAGRGGMATVKLLLEHGGVDVNSKDSEGRTPLSYIAGSEFRDEDDVATVKLLLEHGGIDVNTKDNHGRTPLSYAAPWNDEDIFKLLLEHGGIEVDSMDNNGRTPLSHAAEEAGEATVRLLLEHGGVDVNSKDNKGWTPLLYVVNSESEDEVGVAIIKLLLEHGGIEVNTKDNHGRTPLSYATLRCNEAMVKLLLEHGSVEVDSKDNDGRTPLSHAARRDDEAIVKLLLEHGGVEVDSKDNNGRTPLSHAAESGEEATVKLLLEHGGVEVDLRDNDGRTPLSHAAKRGREATIKLLLEHGGIDIDSRDNNGRTPLSYAAGAGMGAIVKLLLEHGGIEIDSKDNNGRTPLSHAAQWGREANVKLLLEHGGIKVNQEDNQGQTPLSYAPQCVKASIVKLLLEYGCIKVDVNSADKEGKTVLYYARQRRFNWLGQEYQRIERLLEANGAIDNNDW